MNEHLFRKIFVRRYIGHAIKGINVKMKKRKISGLLFKMNLNLEFVYLLHLKYKNQMYYFWHIFMKYQLIFPY